MPEVAIYVGDVRLVGENDSAASGADETLRLAAERLSGIGDQLANIFSKMNPAQIAKGAETLDLEIGFAIEAGAGEVLKLIISPKVGLSCKATVRWKFNKDGQVTTAGLA